jgi:PTS system nitrogen regulatory IIA component
MSITSLLATDRIFTDQPVSSKKKLLEFIAEKAAKELSLPQNKVYNKLLERERLGSTGLGKGIAVPHARLANLKDAHACLVKLKNAIDYDASDKQKVDLVFVLFIPEESTDEHLQILAKLARVFSQKSVTEAIRISTTPQEIIDIISKAENTA